MEREKAFEAFKIAISINPKNSDVYINLGNLWRKDNEPDRALACYDKALQVEPRLITAHNMKSEILMELGQIDQAVEGFLFVSRHDPNNYKAYNNLGLCYYDLGLFSNASKYFQK